MAIPSLALAAYNNALSQSGAIQSKVARSLVKPAAPTEGFGQMLTDSIKRVNDMQGAKDNRVESVASGQPQNVHELMINLQKASSAMQMTTAVRGKVIEAYRELVKIQF